MIQENIDNEKLFHTLREVIAQIPYGHVATLEEIARELGTNNEDVIRWAVRAAQEVGDITIPTYRVVRDDGTLIDPKLHEIWEKQKEMLENEEITFTDQNKVDLAEHFWSVCEYLEGKEES